MMRKEKVRVKFGYYFLKIKKIKDKIVKKIKITRVYFYCPVNINSQKKNKKRSIKSIIGKQVYDNMD